MSKNHDLVPAAGAKGQGVLTTPQRAASRFQFGERFVAVAEIEVTPAGMLAVGAMVGAILLGSAVIVRAAKGHRHP